MLLGIVVDHILSLDILINHIESGTLDFQSQTPYDVNQASAHKDFVSSSEYNINMSLIHLEVL